MLVHGDDVCIMEKGQTQVLKVCVVEVGGGRDVLEHPDTLRRTPRPPPDQSDHRGKKRNLPSEKPCRAIFGTHNSVSQTPSSPPLIPGRVLLWIHKSAHLRWLEAP